MTSVHTFSYTYRPSSLCDDDDNICKDGLHLSKLKDKDKGKSKSYAALRLDKGQQHLSLYRDGELVDQMVTTPLGAAPPDNSRSCMVSQCKPAVLTQVHGDYGPCHKL